MGMSVRHSDMVRHFTINKYRAQRQQELVRINNLKNHIYEKHQKIRKNLEKKHNINDLNHYDGGEEYLNAMDDHTLTVEEVIKRYQTDIRKGLPENLKQDLRKKHGRNKVTIDHQKSSFLLFLEQITDPFSLFMWLLIVLALVAFGLSSDTNALFLAIIVLITIVTSGLLAYSFTKDSQNMLKKLKDLVPQSAHVIRDGVKCTVVNEELLPGDIVILSPGQIIPADLRIIECNGMKIDQSIFTGQIEPKDATADPVDYTNAFQSKNIIYNGYINTRGDGKGVVIRTGNETLLSKLAKITASQEKKETSIEKSIAIYVKKMTIFAISIGLIVLFSGVLIGYPWLIAAMIAIGVTLASAPGVLNLQVTILLTMAVKKLSDKKMISKNLHVIEELGSTTCICADKTGTLTKNEMVVSNIHFNKTNFQADYFLKNIEQENKHFAELMKCAILSSNASFDQKEPPFQDLKRIYRENISEAKKQKKIQQFRQNWKEQRKNKEKWQLPIIGDSTQSAIIKYFQKISDIEQIRKKFPIKKEHNEDLHCRFDSINKFSYSICQEETESSYYSIFIKGAPQIIWRMCNRVYCERKLDHKWSMHENNFGEFIKIHGDKSERILGFAKKPLPKQKFPKDFVKSYKTQIKIQLNDMIFLGMISLLDPPKKGVNETMLRLKAAGIKIVMLTGDQEETAVAVAKKCNIIQQLKTVNQIMTDQGISFEEALPYSEAVVVTGQKITQLITTDQFVNYTQKGNSLQKVLSKRQVVFARTNPSQKYEIVQALKNMGHVVTVIGDGVNDSPAVKDSSAGISMGSGADATRSAADIIIDDDDVNKILDGIEEGRKLFDNLKKSICYVMTSQVSQWAPFIVLIVARIPIPVFTLLIDGTADFVPAISYAFEHGQIGIMTRKPRNQQQDLVTYKLILQCSGWMGFSSFLCSMLCFFICMTDFGFVPSGLWGKNNIDILIPAATDYYNPTSPYFGNSNLAKLNSCAEFDFQTEKIDWINSLHPEVDLRLAAVTCTDTVTGPIFQHNLPFGQCRIQQISIITHKPVCFSTEAAKYGQTSYMYANVVNQIFNLFICKTRRESLFSQRMDNYVTYFGLAVEIMLALALNQTLFMVELIGTRDTLYIHFGIGAIPFGMIQLIMDEIRKYLIRNLPPDNMGHANRKAEDCRPNWFQRNTLW